MIFIFLYPFIICQKMIFWTLFDNYDMTRNVMKDANMGTLGMAIVVYLPVYRALKGSIMMRQMQVVAKIVLQAFQTVIWPVHR